MSRYRMKWRGSSLVAATAVLGALVIAPTVANSTPASTNNAAANATPTGCTLGNGVSHVVDIMFDNVHFFRDNPNVLSDLEQMPALTNFIESNGVMDSNEHTPLIAHTADDILTSLTGLYGDRQGVGISNSYDYYNPTGTATGATAFSYWTDPILNSSGDTPSTSDHNPNLVYSATVPAQATTSTATGVDTGAPAPWVPFTRAGCNVGAVSTANMELENNGDITQVFGASSPEVAQLNADSDSFKDQETNDYLGVSVHCGQGPDSSVCANAQAVKYGQTAPSHTASPDLLPDEPGGYNGYLALDGHKYVAPVLGAGTPNVTRNGYQVTNASGNLVDLAGKEIDGQFVHTPGFPGFGPISAAQSLAYVADMQESGVPVTYGYISDVHGNNGNAQACSSSSEPTGALGPGDPCDEAQAAAYNTAFATFFARLAADGITPANTEFIFSADEGDHFAGANVGRAVTPSCTGVPDTLSYTCSYAPGQIGELNGNLTGLLATEKSDTTPFKVEADTAPEFYITGNPGPTSGTTRNLERDVASLTANNPYAGATNVSGTGQPIANWLADPTEERILHFVDADPNRTPSFAMFAKPDYFLSTGATTCPATPPKGGTATGTPCVPISPSFAWDHGDYAPEINTTWLGLVGPGVAHLGLDGLGAGQGPSSAGPNSGQGTIPQEQNPGIWTDHADIQPTLMHLVGLSDDYIPDGRVITEFLTPKSVPSGLKDPLAGQFGTCYKQLDSSVGEFGTDTLEADTAAVKTGSSTSDSAYASFLPGLNLLANARDKVATGMKDELDDAAFNKGHINPIAGRALLTTCGAILTGAQALQRATQG